MAKTFVGLAMSSTMFGREALISRRVLDAEEAKRIISGEIVSCFNPSHIATIEAIRTHFDIEVEIPETAPKVTLEQGDSLLVLSARFPRRLNEGERFSSEEVDSVSFELVEYTVEFSTTCKGCGKQIPNPQNLKKGSGWWVNCPWCNCKSQV